MEKILTISIAAYNAAGCISDCLDSIVASKGIDAIDAVVVNDGSIDNTKEVVQQYVEKYPNSVRLVDKANGGHGSTINSSIKIATGKYYKVVDADDKVHTDALDRLIAVLRGCSADWVINTYDEVYPDHTRAVGFDELVPSIQFETGTTMSLESIAGCLELRMHTITVRTDIIKTIRPLDENCFYVDVEYLVFQVPEVSTVLLLDDSVYEYTLGNAGQSVDKRNMEKRVKQHERVVLRLADFYTEVADRLTVGQEELMRRRINAMVSANYLIYIRMNSAEAGAEVKKFDNYLKQYPAIYKSSIEKEVGKKPLSDVCVRSLRKHDYANFASVQKRVRLWDRLKGRD